MLAADGGRKTFSRAQRSTAVTPSHFEAVMLPADGRAQNILQGSEIHRGDPLMASHPRYVSMTNMLGQRYIQSNSSINSPILSTLPIRDCAPPLPLILPTRCGQFGAKRQGDKKTSGYHPVPCTLHCLGGTWECPATT